MKRIFYFGLLIFSMLGLHQQISAQCCAAGNPVGGDGSQDALKKHQLNVSANYRNSFSRDYFHLNEKEDIENIEKSYYNFSSLSLSYGFNWRFTIHTEMGYYFNKVQVVNLSDGQQTIKANGLGDLSLTLRYSLLPQKIINPHRLIFSLGARFPVGVFDDEKDGVKIPVSLQPSSGALKINSALFFSQKKPDNQFGWSTFAFFEWSNQINEGIFVYKYGNLLMVEATAFYSPKPAFVFSLSAKAEFRGKDEKGNGYVIESTGSRVVYIKPLAQVSLTHDLNLVTFAELPVYKYVNGYQLTNLYAFQIGLRKTFSL